MDAVFEKLVEINALGIGIVMVEQNARRALALAHRGYVLETGRNAIEGAAPTCSATRRSPSSTSAARDDRVELELDERAVGDEPDDEVGRVRGVDARERLACARIAASSRSPASAAAACGARPPSRAELAGGGERAAITSRACS